MPPKPVPYRVVQRKLIAAGFRVVGQEGSHVKFARTDLHGTRTTVVPHHREVSIGTLHSILRQAGMSSDEWDRL